MTHTNSTPANPAQGVSAELWALCYLNDWEPPHEGQQHRWEPGKNVFPEVHAFYHSWREAEAVRADMTNPEKYWVVRTRPESEARLAKFAAIGVGGQAARLCTCHPDDNPPVPCAEKYALSECLTHPAPSGQAVAVKALEWEGEPIIFADGSGAYMAEAGTFGFGYYTIYRDDRNGCVYTVSHSNRTISGTYSTSEEAKAAAQADYERLILSAPSNPPARPGCEPGEKLRAAIHQFESEVKAGGGYMPAISTLLRIYADEMADKYPNDVNGGRPAAPLPGGAK